MGLGYDSPAMGSDPTVAGAIFSGPAVEGPATRQAGFWQRTFAFVIDSTIVAILCLVLGLFFKNFFSRQPVEGSIIGFAIALVYFALLARIVGNGQTLGQRFFNLTVISRDGNSLSLPRSLLRYAILLAPLYLGTAVAAVGLRSLSWLMDTASFAIFYLYIFNWRTRQSLHDLATDAFVIDAPGNGKVMTPGFWPWHWAILGLVLILIANNGLFIGTSNEALPELRAIQKAVIDSGKVQGIPNVSLEENTAPPRIIRTLRVTIVPKGILEKL
jgi:uncharacterized RDD family membrane protein YckC